MLQINGGDIDKVIASLPDVKEDQLDRLRTRCRCAWNWITTFSPEDFRFALADENTELVSLADEDLKAVKLLAKKVSEWDGEDEKDLAQRIYDTASEAGIENMALFTAVYRVLIGKEKGPKLAQFMKTVGKQKILEILNRY